jgi:hypothetical protein
MVGCSLSHRPTSNAIDEFRLGPAAPTSLQSAQGRELVDSDEMRGAE